MIPKPIDENLRFRIEFQQSCETSDKSKAAAIVLHRKEIISFFDICLWTFDPRKKPSDRPFITWDYQEDYIKDINTSIQKGESVFTEKTRDMGATWMILGVFLYRWLVFDENFLIGSRKEELVDKIGSLDSLFERLRYMIKTMPPWILDQFGFDKKNVSYMKMFKENGASIVGESMNENFSRQGRYKAILLDEFAFVEKAENIWTACGDSAPCKLPVSTPNGNLNKFARLRKSGKIRVVSLHWKQHPEKDEAWYERQKRDRTDRDVAQELDINYTVSSGKPFYGGFVRALHALKIQPNPYKELILGWDYGYHYPCCYDKDTEILTSTGWKLFRNISNSEVVATLNPISNKIEYQKIQAKIHYKFNGNMYHWKSAGNLGCDIRVTDHHMMVGYNKHFKNLEFKTAYQVGKQAAKTRFSLVTSGIWEGTDKDFLTNIEFSTFCEFMGIWLSEGSLAHGYGGKKHYNIWVWQKERNGRIEDVLNKMPCKFSRQEKSEGWVAGSKEIYGYLKKFGGSYDKYVPQEIKDSSIESIKKFIDMYELGDGSWKKSVVMGRYCNLVTTASKKMADDLQELYVKIGISSRVRQVTRKNNRVYYEVRKNVNYHLHLKNKHLTTENVKNEDVYCVTVPNHTVLVRRKEGRAVFCGNCIISQVDSKGRWCILDCIMGKDQLIDDFGNQIKEHINMKYKGYSVTCYGDPAGNQESDKSKKTSVQILDDVGFSVFSIPSNRSDTNYYARKKIIEGKLKKLIDGLPELIINDTPRNNIIIEAFEGGYHYPEANRHGLIMDKPVQDGYYEHPINCLDYIAVNIFSPVPQHDSEGGMTAKVVGDLKDIHWEVDEEDDNRNRYIRASKGAYTDD